MNTAAAALGFKRLVLGIQSRVHDHDLRLAVGLASVLDIELEGWFLRDTDLDKLARIPFAREFSVLGGGWRTIDLDRMAHELELVVGHTERTLMEAAARASKRCRFEVKHGPIAETIAAVTQSTDIVVIFEPANPVEHSTQQFSSLLEAAFQSAAAVMLIPSRTARDSGPIAVLADDSDDPSLSAAARIAAVTKEELVILPIGQFRAGDAMRKIAASYHLSPKKLRLGPAALADTVAVIQEHHLQERILVMSRGAVDMKTTMSIMSGRRVPVLIIERPRTDALRAQE